jgi:hypothetical protein
MTELFLSPKYEELDCPGKLGKAYISKNFPEFYKYLIKRYENYNYTKFSELLYCYYNNIIEHPRCPVCNKELPFLGKSRGYQKYCSLKCSNSDDDVKAKKVLTNIKRYGVPYAAQNEELKQKIINTTIKKYGGMGNASKSIKEKQNATMNELYGVNVFSQNEELKQKSINTLIDRYGGVGTASTEIQSKIEETNLQKYGVKAALNNKDIRKKIEETNLQKYGVKIPSQNNIIAKKISETKCKQIRKKYHHFIDVYKENNIIYYKIQCPHPDCNKCKDKFYIIPAKTYFDRTKDKTEICTNLLPVQKYHGKDTTLELFVKNILDEHNIEYETNVRNIIVPKELDIYIPSKNIAIECNGIYWHSSFEKPNNYHINKYRLCKERNIQLMSIWEDWIRNKPEIVESILLSKLGLIGNTIYARKCIIKEVDSKTCNCFLEANHIQGSLNSTIKLGLYYKDELVSVMTFCKERNGMGGKHLKKETWELARFCNKLNTRVIGGASKLLKHFIKNYNPKSIVSFSMNDVSNGNLYKTLGFESDYKITSSYWYIDDNIRYHRLNYTKDAIINKGLAPNDDKNTWTEFEVMEKLGFLRIYDSGQLKWEYNIK